MSRGRPGAPSKREIALSMAFYGGVAPPPAAPRRPQGRPEAEVLVEVMGALRRHPAVSWCERVNSGVVQVDGRWIRYGWPGASDLLGQLRDGRLLAVECKSASGRLTDEQAKFLAKVERAGGVAVVAGSVADVEHALALAAARPALQPLQALEKVRTARHPSEAPIARQRPASQAGGGVPARAPPATEEGRP